MYERAVESIFQAPFLGLGRGRGCQQRTIAKYGDGLTFVALKRGSSSRWLAALLDHFSISLNHSCCFFGVMARNRYMHASSWTKSKKKEGVRVVMQLASVCAKRHAVMSSATASRE